MESAGAGAGAGAPKIPNVETFRAAIRYVLNGGKGVSIDDFFWKPVVETPMILYRGQCATSSKAIERRGTDPLQISTTLQPPRPISTSSRLTNKIISFSCPPEKRGAAAGGNDSVSKKKGRVFQITALPGVMIADIYDQIPLELQTYQDIPEEELAVRKEILKSLFEFLPAEIPEDSGYAGKSIDQLFGLFFSILRKEREILLDPRTIQFVQADLKTPETWVEEEIMSPMYKEEKRGKVVEKDVKGKAKAKAKGKAAGGEAADAVEQAQVYPTVAIPRPKAGGARRKTRRRKSKRGTRKLFR